jgi:malate/lactate dehydrogenase
LIVAENFSALTRLDHNRAVGQLAIKAGCDVEDVSGAIIWGNHSSTQYPDINSATIKGASVPTFPFPFPLPFPRHSHTPPNLPSATPLRGL